MRHEQRVAMVKNLIRKNLPKNEIGMKLHLSEYKVDKLFCEGHANGWEEFRHYDPKYEVATRDNLGKVLLDKMARGTSGADMVDSKIFKVEAVGDDLYRITRK